MAKRFIDTNYYKSPFVRSLKGALKGLYTFIICDCDGAGIWVKDLPIASAYIGFEIKESDFNIFIESGKAIDLKNGKYFFPDFIEHQYPNGLQEKNPAHKNFINDLLKYSLLDENLKPLQSPFQGSKVMVKVVVKVKEEVKPPTLEEFLEYSKEKSGNDFEALKKSLELKYASWVENGWKTGHDKKIKNWKATLLNTIQHLPKDQLKQSTNKPFVVEMGKPAKV
jgi:hypothetical protein